MKMVKILFVFGIILLFHSCRFHIEQRRYSKGFYFVKNRINSIDALTNSIDSTYPNNQDISGKSIVINEANPLNISSESNKIDSVYPTASSNEELIKHNPVLEKSSEKESFSDASDSYIKNITDIRPKERSTGMKIFFTVLTVLAGLLLTFGVFAMAVGIGFGSNIPGIAIYILLGGIALVTFFTSMVIFKIWKKRTASDNENKKQKRRIGLISAGVTLAVILLFILVAM